MSIYQLKPTFQSFLRPGVNTLARAGITANQITVFAMMLSVGTGIILFYGRSEKLFILIPIVLFIRMALNAIDGMLAREYGMKSHLGAILNEMGDVVSDAALYWPFAYLGLFRPILVVGAVIFAILTEMVGVVAVQIGASRRYDGPMGKSDRAFTFSIIAILIAANVTIEAYGDIVFIALILLLTLTIINRAAKALKEVS